RWIASTPSPKGLVSPERCAMVNPVRKRRRRMPSPHRTRPMLESRINALVLTVLIAIWLTTGLSAQDRGQKIAPKNDPQQQQGGMGGISSAGNFAPVYDAQKHPITAGGFVDK